MDDYELNVIGKVSIKDVDNILNFLDDLYKSDFENLKAITLYNVDVKIYHNDKKILIKECE